MGQVLVRNLDERVIERLKTRAELHGHSLEQELRDILSAAAPLTSEEKFEISRRLVEKSPSLRHVDPGAAVRYGRDDEDVP
jgi:antitoxin FitA